MKPKIVFIPTYWYLSNPVFFSVVKEFRERFHTVYFNTKDPVFSRHSETNIKKEEVLEYFDEYEEIDESPFSSKSRGVLSMMRCFRDQKPRLERQLKKLAPDAIVSTSDSSGYINRFCNIWAEKEKIPYIVIQPSFIKVKREKNPLKERIGYLLFNVLLDMPFCRKQKVFGNERSDNYLFVWGEFFKNFYKGLEVEKHTYVTGNPAFDRILKTASNAHIPENIGIDIPHGKPIVTICTQPLETLICKKACGRVNDFYISAISENPQLFFVVKVHPREDIQKYNNILSGVGGNNYIVTKDVNLYDLFKVTDLQMSVSSFTTFEAVVFGIPVVVINPDNLVTLPDNFNGEVELKAALVDELNNCLAKGLSDEYRQVFKIKRKKYLESRIGYLDDKSSKRAAKKIEDIIREKAK